MKGKGPTGEMFISVFFAFRYIVNKLKVKTTTFGFVFLVISTSSRCKHFLLDLILLENSYIAQDPGGDIAGRVDTSPICG